MVRCSKPAIVFAHHCWRESSFEITSFRSHFWFSLHYCLAVWSWNIRERCKLSFAVLQLGYLREHVCIGAGKSLFVLHYYVHMHSFPYPSVWGELAQWSCESVESMKVTFILASFWGRFKNPWTLPWTRSAAIISKGPFMEICQWHFAMYLNYFCGAMIRYREQENL